MAIRNVYGLSGIDTRQNPTRINRSPARSANEARAPHPSHPPDGIQHLYRVRGKGNVPAPLGLPARFPVGLLSLVPFRLFPHHRATLSKIRACQPGTSRAMCRTHLFNVRRPRERCTITSRSEGLYDQPPLGWWWRLMALLLQQGSDPGDGEERENGEHDPDHGRITFKKQVA